MATLLTAATCAAANETVFHPAERVTDSSANYRMTRNPSRQAAFDDAGTLHGVWWTGSLATTPESPSEILYAAWSRDDGWSAMETVDDSYVGDGVRVGGRQPTLAVAMDGTVWVTWQDHRHCNPGSPNNWIDNVEIYADSRPPGGAFSSTDLRLTTSSAPHFGDNAYTPRVAVGDDGELRVAWYDFHYDQNVSDLFVKSAPPAGTFDLLESMADMRISRLEDRPIGPPFGPAALSQPDIAAGPNGDWYVIWTEGFGLPGPLLFSPIPTEGYLGPGEVVAVFSDGYNNPASVRVAPDQSIWVGWTDRGTEVPRVALRKRGAATGTFGTVWFPAGGTTRTEGLSFAIDDAGLIHATWVEVEAFQQNRIWYAVLDPSDRSVVHEEVLTPEPGAWVKPCVVLDEADVPHVLFGEYYGDAPQDTGDIWFAAGIAPEPTVGGDLWSIF